MGVRPLWMIASEWPQQSQQQQASAPSLMRSSEVGAFNAERPVDGAHAVSRGLMAERLVH